MPTACGTAARRGHACTRLAVVAALAGLALVCGATSDKTASAVGAAAHASGATRDAGLAAADASHTLSDAAPTATHATGDGLWIHVEGWRQLPHSYAVVCQFITLELVRLAHAGDGDCATVSRVTFDDAPLYQPHWRRVQGLFSDDDEAVLTGLPMYSQRGPDGAALPSGEPHDVGDAAPLMTDVSPHVPDATLRFQFPLDLDGSPSLATLTFGTTEYVVGVDAMLADVGSTKQRGWAGAEATVVAPSQWALLGFLRSDVPEGRTALLPHGVNTRVFRPPDGPEARNALRERLGWAERFVVLNVGSMTSNKGVEELSSAFASLMHAWTAARDRGHKAPRPLLVLKGADELYASSSYASRALSRSELRPAPLAGNDAGSVGEDATADATALLAELGLDEDVRYFGGTLSFAAVAELYQAADVYASPYRAEGFNLPVLEAAACGLPVIVTEGGSTDDFTDDSFALRLPSQLVQVQYSGEAGAMRVPDAMALEASLLYAWRGDGGSYAGGDDEIVAASREAVKRIVAAKGDPAQWMASARAAGPQFVASAGLTWEAVAHNLLVDVTQRAGAVAQARGLVHAHRRIARAAQALRSDGCGVQARSTASSTVGGDGDDGGDGSSVSLASLAEDATPPAFVVGDSAVVSVARAGAADAGAAWCLHLRRVAGSPVAGAAASAGPHYVCWQWDDAEGNDGGDTCGVQVADIALSRLPYGVYAARLQPQGGLGDKPTRVSSDSPAIVAVSTPSGPHGGDQAFAPAVIIRSSSAAVSDAAAGVGLGEDVRHVRIVSLTATDRGRLTHRTVEEPQGFTAIPGADDDVNSAVSPFAVAAMVAGRPWVDLRDGGDGNDGVAVRLQVLGVHAGEAGSDAQRECAGSARPLAARVTGSVAHKAARTLADSEGGAPAEADASLVFDALLELGAVADAAALVLETWHVSYDGDDTGAATSAGARAWPLRLLGAVPAVMSSSSNVEARRASVARALTLAADSLSARRTHSQVARFLGSGSPACGDAVSCAPLLPGGYLGLPSPYLSYSGHDDRALSQLASSLYLQSSHGARLARVAPHCSSAAASAAAGDSSAARVLRDQLGGRPNDTDTRDGIRVGFLSLNLYNHSLGKALAGLIGSLADGDIGAAHGFHIVVFVGPGDLARAHGQAGDGGGDVVVSYLASLQHATVVELPARVASAQHAVERERLDVLVFGDAPMAPLSYHLSFARLAPVQVAFWGAPGSLGHPHGSIDYFVAGEASADVVGGGDSGVRRGGDIGGEDFSEQVVWLSGLAARLFRPQFPAPPATSDQRLTALREHIGINVTSGEGGEGGASIVYVCIQALVKTHPSFDAALLALLRAEPSAVVVLLEGRGLLWAELLARRLARGVRSDLHGASGAAGGDGVAMLASADSAALLRRVVVLPRLSTAQYTLLLGCATVVLDSFPYSGFTTSVEALTMGKAVVTLATRDTPLRGRQTAALYNLMGMSESPLVATSVAAYVQAALRAGRDAAWRAAAEAAIDEASHRLFNDADAVADWAAFLDRAAGRGRM